MGEVVQTSQDSETGPPRSSERGRERRGSGLRKPPRVAAVRLMPAQMPLRCRLCGRQAWLGWLGEAKNGQDRCGHGYRKFLALTLRQTAKASGQTSTQPAAARSLVGFFHIPPHPWSACSACPGPVSPDLMDARTEGSPSNARMEKPMALFWVSGASGQAETANA